MTAFDPHVAPARLLLGAMRRISRLASGSSAGRPGGRCGRVHLRATSPLRQRSSSRDERETCASGLLAGGGLRRPGACGPGASTRGALLGGEGSPPGGKHEILKLDLLGGAILGAKDAEQSTKHHVEECAEHGRDSATHGRLGASCTRETGAEGHDRVFAPDGWRNRGVCRVREVERLRGRRSWSTGDPKL
jgi:hypothetical protein